MANRLWGFGKVRYRGRAKNATRAAATRALADIHLARRGLMAQGAFVKRMQEAKDPANNPIGRNAGEQSRYLQAIATHDRLAVLTALIQLRLNS